MNRNTDKTTGTATRISRKTAVTASGLTAAALLGVFVTSQVADASGAAEKSARPAAAPYVVNHYGEENADTGRAERRPANLVLSEFTGINGVTWKQWGAGKAVGTGDVHGTWCADTCLDKPLKGTITLSDPKTVHGKRVYTTFTLKLSSKPGTYDSEDLQGKRPLATG
ncbi:hypothetical protein ACWGI8_24390 [Streptomyces sp. NPDC054841]